MCGIFGIVARNARIPDGVLERGTQSLAHRGPDDSGTILLRDSVRGSDRNRLGQPASGDSRSLPARPPAHARRRNRQLDRLQRRDLQLPRHSRRTRTSRHELRQPLRHRSRAESLCALGRGVSGEVSRHVCLRALGCAPPPPFHRARSHGHQAALLCAVRLVFSFCLGSSHAARDGPVQSSH